MGIEQLIGRMIVRIDGLEAESDEVFFYMSDGKVYKLYHAQDCCESVYLIDFAGNPFGLEGDIVVHAEEVTQYGCEPKTDECEWCDSCTWTFYKIDGLRGYVTLRWLGQSSGYYSESVDFVEVIEEIEA